MRNAQLDEKKVPKKPAAAKKKNGTAAASGADQIVEVLRAFSVGQYGGRLDLAALRWGTAPGRRAGGERDRRSRRGRDP